ncbi:hypothetical protein BE21_01460 [Sorangium cellulosum]|uniref:Uncharacterized protein n=1 Tax=Sorangium cellulosum TaxID=56 RepID=A0A150TYV5_SORCE|nr:hypothetical protein BE21_01460 [Sorangium cellulosum]
MRLVITASASSRVIRGSRTMLTTASTRRWLPWPGLADLQEPASLGRAIDLGNERAQQARLVLGGMAALASTCDRWRTSASSGTTSRHRSKPRPWQDF